MEDSFSINILILSMALTILNGRSYSDIYRVIEYLPPPSGIFVDVGAAVGATATKIANACPDSPIICFEPNPANHKFFESRHSSNPRIILRKEAVSDTSGTLAFSSRHSIGCDDPRWSEYAGASSIGRITEGGDIPVNVVRLDDVIKAGEIAFLKIDVQGHEASVLRGAARAIKAQSIKLALVEFMIYAEVLDIFRDYICLAQKWTIIPRTSKTNPPSLSAWHLGEPRRLSTGKMFYPAWPKNYLYWSKSEFLQFQAQQNSLVGRCWVDLLFVAPDYVETYIAAAEASRRQLS